MTTFEAGFGVVQNASLSLMFERVSKADDGTASAVWNVANDAGMGGGAAAFGLLAAHTGHAWAFALTGLMTLGALVPAWRDQAR